DTRGASIIATTLVAARQPAVSEQRIFVFMVQSPRIWAMREFPGRDRPRHSVPASLRMRGCRAQDWVVLGEDPVLLGVVLVTLVARAGGFHSRLRRERVLVAEAEVGPVAGLVLEALRVLDRGVQARELALEVAVTADRLLGSDAGEFFDHDRAITELAGLLVIGEALGVDVDIVELWEISSAVVEVVGCSASCTIKAAPPR